MLNEVIGSVKEITKNLGNVLTGYTPREQQKRMIYEIVKGLISPKDSSIIVCEAGTGVGKSLGYLISVIPSAILLKKKIILSTATIALQEQLLNKDLPLFFSAFDKKLKYTLAKGRSNYVCSHALFDVVTEIEEHGGFDLLKDTSDLSLAKELFENLKTNKWNGERASYPSKIPDMLWNKIKSDSSFCVKKTHKNCPFYQARAELDSCDIIVANHALVLSDLQLGDGGGVLLPESNQSIYVFDEGHHLPSIARERHSYAFSISGSIDLFNSIKKAMTRHKKRIGKKQILPLSKKCIGQVSEHIPSISKQLKEIDNHYLLNKSLFLDNTYILRELNSFENELFCSLKKQVYSILALLRKIISEVDKVVKENIVFKAEKEKKEITQIIVDCLFFINKLANIDNVLSSFIEEDSDFGIFAKWIELNETKGFSLHSCPISASKILKKILWEYADNVIITSATLSGLGNFELYKTEVGLPSPAKAFRLGSPFDFKNKASLYLPTDNKISPKNQDLFTTFLQKELFTRYLVGQKSSLVLFSSYWQMKSVQKDLQIIAKDNGYKLQCQNDSPKEVILKNHKSFVSQGIPSILMGTGSFSEGLDLPRELLENVIITKIPFAIPNDPISIIQCEYLEKQGKNPFFEVHLPSASRSLIQAVGRLIRTEDDTGRVIILDNRMTSTRYGKQLLASLPPFLTLFKNP